HTGASERGPSSGTASAAGTIGELDEPAVQACDDRLVILGLFGIDHSFEAARRKLQTRFAANFVLVRKRATFLAKPRIVEVRANVLVDRPPVPVGAPRPSLW